MVYVAPGAELVWPPRNEAERSGAKPRGRGRGRRNTHLIHLDNKILPPPNTPSSPTDCGCKPEESPNLAKTR